MTTTNAAQSNKTVADPNAAYDSLRPSWKKCRAVCNGQEFVKDYDARIDVRSFSNLLIPFSPSMTQRQYNFYKAEAELPGITAQFSKMLVGGLLRKKPTITLPDGVPEGALDWITNQFAQDGSSLMSFLDAALWEEIQTSRAWVYIDHPVVDENADLDKEEKDKLRPYPVIWTSEMVINWRMKKDGVGKGTLDRVIVFGLTEEYDDAANEFHAKYVETVWVHEIVEGLYQIRVFKKEAPTSSVTVTNGTTELKPEGQAVYKLEETLTDIKANGERLTIIPAWPLNGAVETQQPILTAIIDKELALYNKISRRNHLLYGAATYTPIICDNMTDEDFDLMVNKGLGSWLKLSAEGSATILETPTDALADMDRAIAAGIEEMARLGIRMLSPETEQSGVALQLRNASQTAQLGTLNSKVSSIMSQIITFMLNWHYDLELGPDEVIFSLSADFNPTPLGADWLRLATEWYEKGLIPRSVWLEILKHNDMVNPDYNDEDGKKEITDDQDLLLKNQQGFGDGFANNITSQIQNGLQPPKPTPAAPKPKPAEK
jgi:hypothetical protein